MHLEDADDVTYTYEVPQQKSMLMRITFYNTADDGTLVFLRQDSIGLAHAMTYYTSISCALGKCSADGSYRAGIVYW